MASDMNLIVGSFLPSVSAKDAMYIIIHMIESPLMLVLLWKCYDMTICHTTFEGFHRESVLTKLQTIMFSYLVLKSTMIVSNPAFLFCNKLL
jgi:hypothetical protein